MRHQRLPGFVGGSPNRHRDVAHGQVHRQQFRKLLEVELKGLGPRLSAWRISVILRVADVSARWRSGQSWNRLRSTTSYVASSFGKQHLEGAVRSRFGMGKDLAANLVRLELNGGWHRGPRPGPRGRLHCPPSKSPVRRWPGPILLSFPATGPSLAPGAGSCRKADRDHRPGKSLRNSRDGTISAPTGSSRSGSCPAPPVHRRARSRGPSNYG